MAEEQKYGPFHRLVDLPDAIDKIIESGELRGGVPRNYFRSDIPKVKAYRGALPPDRKGFQFETKVEPDTGCPPDQAFWSNGRRGVTVDGDCVKIKINVTKVQK